MTKRLLLFLGVEEVSGDSLMNFFYILPIVFLGYSSGDLTITYNIGLDPEFFL